MRLWGCVIKPSLVPLQGIAVVAVLAQAACTAPGPATAPTTPYTGQRATIQRALEYLPDGQSIEWGDAEGVVVGVVVVERTFQRADGVFCRVFSVRQPAAMTVGFEPQTWCRIGAGNWQVNEG